MDLRIRIAGDGRMEEVYPCARLESGMLIEVVTTVLMVLSLPLAVVWTSTWLSVINMVAVFFEDMRDIRAR